MKLKHTLILVYALIAAIYASYEHFFGPNAGMAWGRCIGHALVWPAVLIPGLGSFIGGALIIAFVVAMAVL